MPNCSAGPCEHAFAWQMCIHVCVYLISASFIERKVRLFPKQGIPPLKMNCNDEYM